MNDITELSAEDHADVDSVLRLITISESIRKGDQPRPVVVRELLSWFGAQRRGPYIVERIRNALSNARLVTVPDFEGEYIDSEIRFELAPPVIKSAVGTAEGNSTVTAVSVALVDPTYRIGKLPSANNPPISVAPNETISAAVTIMLTNNFSQLPVMNGERDLKGVISWSTIGSRFALGAECKEVRECMEPPAVISADTSLFGAIDDIVRNQYVLIVDGTKKICGIVTTSDLSVQFRLLAEPFLLLGEIENHIRRMIERGSFSHDELKSFGDPSDARRSVDSVSELTLGECKRLLENKERWERINSSLDRRTFIEGLDAVLQIRNDVMHFDPDPISDDDLRQLRNFTRLLQKMHLIESRAS